MRGAESLKIGFGDETREFAAATRAADFRAAAETSARRLDDERAKFLSDFSAVESDAAALRVEAANCSAALEKAISAFDDCARRLRSQSDALESIDRMYKSRVGALLESRNVAAEFAAFLRTALVEREAIEQLLCAPIDARYAAAATQFGQKLDRLRRYAAQSDAARAALGEATRVAAESAQRIAERVGALVAALCGEGDAAARAELERDAELIFFVKENAPNVYFELARSYQSRVAKAILQTTRGAFGESEAAAPKTLSQRFVALDAPPSDARGAAHFEERLRAVVEPLARRAVDEYVFCKRTFTPIENEAVVLFALVLRPAFLAAIEWSAALGAPVEVEECLLAAAALGRTRQRARERRVQVVERFLSHFDALVERAFRRLAETRPPRADALRICALGLLTAPEMTESLLQRVFAETPETAREEIARICARIRGNAELPICALEMLKK